MAPGRARMLAAAAIIANEARALSAPWSEQIPATMKVEAGDSTAVISSGVGPSYPAEFKKMHPLFGDREHWYAPPGPPFLGPAAVAKADAAAAEIAKTIPDFCRSLGFTVT